MDTARFVESLHAGYERTSTVVVDLGDGKQSSACSLGGVLGMALAKAELARRLQAHSGKAKKQCAQ